MQFLNWKIVSFVISLQFVLGNLYTQSWRSNMRFHFLPPELLVLLIPPIAWVAETPIIKGVLYHNNSIITGAMMTSSNENIFRVTGPLCGEFTGPGEFPTQRPVTRSFDVFFDLRLNKRLSKQPWSWWFETPAWSLWRHRNASHIKIPSYQYRDNKIPLPGKTVFVSRPGPSGLSGPYPGFGLRAAARLLRWNPVLLCQRSWKLP